MLFEETYSLNRCFIYFLKNLDGGSEIRIWSGNILFNCLEPHFQLPHEQFFSYKAAVAITVDRAANGLLAVRAK
jgi:hypothetical protein